MDLCTASSLDMKFILDLYQKTFPDAERKSFSLIERKAAMGSMEILLIKEDNKRVGFAMTANAADVILLDYFAIADAYQGQGIGTEAFLWLRELYSDKQFFLEIEETDEKQPDYQDRLRRKEFYLRNGMLETGIHVELFGVGLELLATNKELHYDDCERLYRELLGPAYRTMLRRII